MIKQVQHILNTRQHNIRKHSAISLFVALLVVINSGVNACNFTRVACCYSSWGIMR